MSHWKRLNREAENFLAFPVLVALSNRPLNARELSHALLVSRDTIYLRCRELESLGYIVQRKKDNRWVMVVQLQKGGLLEPTGVPGIHPDTPPKQGPPREVFPVVTPPVPQDAPERTRGAVVGSPVAPPKPSVPGGNVAVERQARHFNIPAMVEGEGWLSVGKLEPCSVCHAVTPIKYGTTSICASCARAGNIVGGN